MLSVVYDSVKGEQRKKEVKIVWFGVSPRGGLY